MQFHAGFTFQDAIAIIPYLSELGITHVYASPYLRARAGSTHGYDIVDHHQLNPEIGSAADHAAFVDALQRQGMSHILDIVPNHMGVATNDNALWNDVLRNGRQSAYADWFDIAWRGSPRLELQDKVLLPVLGKPYGEALEAGEIKISADDTGPYATYYERRFPIRSLTSNDGQDVDALDQLLDQQSYRLAYWRVASEEINYRRFFDINDLAALRMEREDVFRHAHELIFNWLSTGQLAGLRVDHPDGLYDPRQYFRRLQQQFILACARHPLADDARFAQLKWDEIEPDIVERLSRADLTAGGCPLYVVAEKILGAGEELRADWAVSGTSGYDFVNKINGLFVEAANEGALTWAYKQWLGHQTSFEELVYDKKRLILEMSLASDFERLAHQLDQLAQAGRRTRDFTLRALREVLREVIVAFPVYRSYVSQEGIDAADQYSIDSAIKKAKERNPPLDAGIFNFLHDVLLLKVNGTQDQTREFVARFQQLTAPVTAKGIEDTAFYLYNRLTSLSEVGGEPDRFGVTPAALHTYLQDRQSRWPYALSPLSTHDTKRSEDVRARINVLSELPEEWLQRVMRWREINQVRRQEVAGTSRPTPNDEYLFYQTLVGAWPMEEMEQAKRQTFIERIQAYMVKAVREGKINSTWTQPNEAYEKGLQEFVASVCDEANHAFLQDFLPFQRRISHVGIFNSLAQTLLHIGAPGVPDTYQGTELWDLSLVDPDNRRPVDYAQRVRLLAELTASVAQQEENWTRELVRTKTDSRIKLFLSWRALCCRRNYPGLFSGGKYVPLEVTGERQDNFFAFARSHGGRWAMVIVPRLLGKLLPDESHLPMGEQFWGDTQIHTTADKSPAMWRDIFTGQRISAPFSVGAILSSFPVALLISDPSSVG